MIEIRKTALAKSDLEDIWLHSFQEWGEAQADTYHDHPTQVIEQLGHNPQLGNPAIMFRQGIAWFKLNDIRFTINSMTTTS